MWLWGSGNNIGWVSISAVYIVGGLGQLGKCPDPVPPKTLSSATYRAQEQVFGDYGKIIWLSTAKKLYRHHYYYVIVPANAWQIFR